MNLQAKILLLITPLVVLPLAWLGWIAYTKLEQNSRETTFGKMSILLDQVSRNASAYLSTVQSNIELFSGSNLIKQYILTTNESDRYSLMQPSLIRLFSSYQRAYPDYYELRILLPDGYEDTRSTLANLNNKTEDESELDFFKQLKQHNGNLYTQYTINPDNGSPVLYVGKKLIFRDALIESADKTPSLRGYLIISSNLNYLQDQLSRFMTNNGFLIITDKNGNPFLSPKNITVTKFSPQQNIKLNKAILDNKPVKINYNGQATFVQVRTIHTGLRIYALLPEDNLLTASRELGSAVIIITLLTIFLASIFIFSVINRILIQPIKVLGAAAYEVGHGRFNESIGITSQDELGDLALSFDEMSRNLQESQNQVNFLAYHDALTGLPNRHLFEKYLKHALAHVERNKSHLGLIFLDLDNFKKVNDSMGHQAGDKLLQELAGRLTESLREEDKITLTRSLPDDTLHNTVARVGGDEFLLLLSDINEPSEAAVIAQRLLDQLLTPFNINDSEFFITSSIGISFYPDDGNDGETLIKNADLAMYHAKNTGRNNFQFFNETMNEAVLERLSLENALRNAIINDEFILHYQPKVDMRNGEIKGVEALIRWQHPELGMMQPNKFIPIAEESNLIIPIGEWVINEATKQMKRWSDEGINIAMSVNISTVQLNKQNVSYIIKKYITENKCIASNLEIEITETSIIDAHDKATNVLNEIKALGVQISMDDFGIGYSSFSYLRNLPIDVLKIDRSFVRDITTDQDDAAIISAILAMAHTLNLEVVAEGVETLEQLHFLHEKKCDIVQGYLISRPLPANELKTTLINKKRINIFNAEIPPTNINSNNRLEIIKNS